MALVPICCIVEETVYTSHADSLITHLIQRFMCHLTKKEISVQPYKDEKSFLNRISCYLGILLIWRDFFSQLLCLSHKWRKQAKRSSCSQPLSRDFSGLCSFPWCNVVYSFDLNWKLVLSRSIYFPIKCVFIRCLWASQ